ncbi:unnamed protein product [Rotaria sordida]|uniref:Uncharacterized protein n=1 Tax=Rotaria sordida TaxID=392033 RepID=A0A814NW41_9BILA|nr:unnamed protein product [Rotaria sordida]
MKAGDLVRYNTRGEFVYAGRADFQIKVCGQRVEPAEIENIVMNWSSDNIILFNSHSIGIDGSSINIFTNDLRQTLTMQALCNNNEDNITYLDYAQYERLQDWSNARQYWNNILAILDNLIDQQNSFIRSSKDYTLIFGLDHDLVINLNYSTSQ